MFRGLDNRLCTLAFENLCAFLHEEEPTIKPENKVEEKLIGAFVDALNRADSKRKQNQANGNRGGRPHNPTITENNPTITENNPTITEKQPSHNQTKPPVPVPVPVPVPEPEPEPEPITKEPKPVYSQDFEDFWGMYPNRKAKGEAWKAWNQMRIRLPAIGELLAIVAQQSRQSDWTRDGGKFIPHPATWLRACRWEDGKASSPSKQATAIVDAQPKPRPTHINHEPITDPEILAFDDETFARFRIEMEKRGAYFS
jgi:hypothetical protein